MEKSIIEKAKCYAKNSGRSLSDLVQSQLEKLVSSSDDDPVKVPEEFQGLFGSVQVSSGQDKESIRSIIRGKHQ